ncbi:MobF family relaxase [Nocardia asiatica]|uniref:MobF family relaxase n=1 Tax=Nocardia asiatica TaxID=209252 RepID=UPI002458E4AB|nr:MobF family relaxase [Nocardia asiatica]
MSLAKIASGDGYEYYLRNIATHDADERGPQALSDYYSERGESPGRWWGSGLAAVNIAVGDEVTESQMWALFGRGWHPNAEAMIVERVAELRAEGISARTAKASALREVARIGTPFAKITVDELSYRAECRRAYEGWNLEHGRDQAAPVPDEVREILSTEVAEAMFAAEYGRDPLTEAELSAWVAKAARPASKAVAGFDLTFSPVKSVSMLWALASPEVAAKIEAAHQAAVVDALEFLEAHATYTRIGRGGVAQVEVDGLLATMFDHRDSRAGDPDLHTHVVVSNKVRRRAGGWGALDGKMFYRHAVTASEIYNTRLEHHLETALGGAEFVERDQLDANKRPVRELAGASPELAAVWSSRAEAITTKLADLSRKFQQRHGREPGPKELWRLAEEATLSTRGGKHHARSRAEQRADWRAEAVRVLGSEDAVDVMVAGMLSRTVPQRDTAATLPVGELAVEIIDTVAEQRATWQAHHIRAEAARRLRGRITPHDFAQALTEVVTAALSDPQSIPRHVVDPTPIALGLTRSDGTSVYSSAESTHYTSPAIVAAEQRLLAAAQLDGGRILPGPAVEVAVVEFAANGYALNPGQQALVQAFATSGQRFQVAVAPAGTGKTTAMRVLTNAWTSEGGTVVGFAPTAKAAGQLAEDSGAPAHTVDLLTTLADHLDTGALDPDTAPQWLHAIDENTLVLIDEAAKTPTLKLDAAVRFLIGRGATIRAIGDDRQLASVTAGGIIRDIVETTAPITLTRVVRFADHGEAAASLALRDGDPAGIAYYADHDRIHTGTLTEAVHAAFRAWRADHARGLDVALLAPTRALVAELNALARAERLDRAERLGIPTGAEIVLGDGLMASAGDIITTRRNARRLRISSTDYVRNGYRWEVTGVLDDGRITATHLGSGRSILLPADYVREHVTLGYASTIDSEQGLTVDSCHGVVTGAESCAQLYVMASRGRTANHLYVNTATAVDEHAAHTYTAVHPPTALDVLTRILARDTTQTSATSQARDATDPARLLGPTVDAYLHALGHIAETRLGADRRAEITAAAEQLAPGVTDADAWPVLAGHLALLELSGRDPIQALTHAAQARELGSAGDVAAVLDWRIDPTGLHSPPGAHGPLRWLPAIPAALGEDSQDRAHLVARAQQITDLADQIATRARTADGGQVPVWAARLHEIDPRLVADLAVWRAAHDVPDTDRRPTGPARYPVAERHEQARLDAAVADRIGDLDIHTRRWNRFAAMLDERLPTDPYWPTLAAELSRAYAAGVDVYTHARTTHAHRPLPAEQPAAALRWRIAEHLDRDRDPEFVDLITELRNQNLRALRDADLASEATRRRNQLRYANPWAGPDRLTRALERREQLLEDHRRRDAQAADIRTAHALARQDTEHTLREADAREAWRAACDDLAALRWWHTRQTRLQRKQHHDDAQEALTQAVALRDATRAELSELRARIGAHESLWPRLLTEAADTTARDSALAAADREIAVGQQDRARDDARRAARRAWAQAPIDEQQRRAELPPDQLEREDRARYEIHAQDNPPPSREEIAAQRAEQQRQQREAERQRQRERWDTPIYDHRPTQSPGYGL